MFDAMEKAASAYWDTLNRQSETMEAMGDGLSALCMVRERQNEMLAKTWDAWGLPSAQDVARLEERLDGVEARLDQILALLREETEHEE